MDWDDFVAEVKVLIEDARASALLAHGNGNVAEADMWLDAKQRLEAVLKTRRVA